MIHSQAWDLISARQSANPAQPCQASVIQALGNLTNKKCLQLGTGDGGALKHLQSLGARTSGLDVSLGQLRRSRQQSPETFLVQGDGHKIPIAQGTFDRVLIDNGVIHFLAHPNIIFDEIFRVLKTNGLLVLHDWHPEHTAEAADWSFDEPEKSHIKLQHPLFPELHFPAHDIVIYPHRTANLLTAINDAGYTDVSLQELNEHLAPERLYDQPDMILITARKS